MFEEIVKTKRFCEDGVEILRFRSSFPHFEGLEEINALYETISENCLKYCEEEIFPKVRELYSADTNEKKRFNFDKCNYELTVSPQKISDNLLSVRADIRLINKSRTIKKNSSAVQNWCPLTQILLCPRSAASRCALDLSKSKILKLLSRCENLLFSENKVLCFAKGEIRSAPEILSAKKQVEKRPQKTSKTVVNQ